jgi:hypothetical protein
MVAGALERGYDFVGLGVGAALLPACDGDDALDEDPPSPPSGQTATVRATAPTATTAAAVARATRRGITVNLPGERVGGRERSAAKRRRR